MQKQNDNNNVRSLGVCYRLFNFIMNEVIFRGLKRLTLGKPKSQGASIEIPIRPSEEEMLQQPHPGNEIVVEFRHNNNEVEYWNTYINNSHNQTPLQKGNEHNQKPRENEARSESKEAMGSKKTGHVSSKSTTVSEVEEHVSTTTNNGVREKGPKKSVSVTNVATDKEKEKNQKKEKGKAIEHEQEKPNKAPPRKNHDHSHMPILGVFANINEKSEEFIRKRKEAMRRIYSNTDSKTS